MPASKYIARAEKAYRAGSCLRAGQLIDRIYVEIGRGRATAADRRRLRLLDEKFEKTCVRKTPKRP